MCIKSAAKFRPNTADAAAKKLPHPPSWQLILGLRTAIVVNSANATTRLSGILNSAFEKFRLFVLTEVAYPLFLGSSLKISVLRIHPQEELPQRFRGISQKAGET